MPTRPAGSGFSWAEDAGAFVETPPASLVDVGYAPGTVAESLTLNDGLRELGLWSQYLAALSPSSGVLALDRLESTDYDASSGTPDGGALLLDDQPLPFGITGSGRGLYFAGPAALRSDSGGLAVQANTGNLTLDGQTVSVVSQSTIGITATSGIFLFDDVLQVIQLGVGWGMYGYAEDSGDYPAVTYDLSMGLGGWMPWRPRLNASLTFGGIGDIDIVHTSSSGAQSQRWRRKLPEMPHFSGSVEMTLSDVEVDVSFGSSTTASSIVTATLYRYSGSGGLLTSIATDSVSGTGTGESSQTITLVAAGHTVDPDSGANYVLDVLVEIENAGTAFAISIDAARMTLEKTGVE